MGLIEKLSVGFLSCMYEGRKEGRKKVCCTALGRAHCTRYRCRMNQCMHHMRSVLGTIVASAGTGRRVTLVEKKIGQKGFSSFSLLLSSSSLSRFSVPLSLCAPCATRAVRYLARTQTRSTRTPTWTTGMLNSTTRKVLLRGGGGF